ncbi:MAG: hypothetical protein HRT72_03265 [Flavobacteriales bacterium]|nr:hypothetical protein [Flavobacteriales bacterium]
MKQSNLESMNIRVLNTPTMVEKKTVVNDTNARVNLFVEPAYLVESVISELVKLKEVGFVALAPSSKTIEVLLSCSDNGQLIQLMDKHIYSIDGVQSAEINVYLDVRHWSKKTTVRKKKIIKESRIEKLAS